MNSYKWIEEVRAKTGIESDNAIAKMLGISRQNICDHKAGRKVAFDDKTCIKIAKITGINAEKIIADQHLEAAKTPEEKAVWASFLKLSGSAAASILGVATALPYLLKSAGVYILCSIEEISQKLTICEPRHIYRPA